jgi:hypothetical protein
MIVESQFKSRYNFCNKNYLTIKEITAYCPFYTVNKSSSLKTTAIVEWLQ